MKIKAIVCEAGKNAVLTEIEDGLESFQSIVGGYIEISYPYKDDVAIVCNEEGKITGLELNRTIRDEDGKILDVIAGTFFVIAAHTDDGETCGIPDELVSKYTDIFLKPETFVKMGGHAYVYTDRYGMQLLV